MKSESVIQSHGLSLDGQIPVTVRTLPSEVKIGEDGNVLLYDKSTQETPYRLITVEKPGRVHYFDDPKDPEDPFVFVQGGYKIEYNNYTGNYSFTINPDFDVDFDFIQRQSEDDRRNLLLQLLYVTPSITVKHETQAEENPQLEMRINRNKSKLYTASPGNKCTWKTDEMSGNFREVEDRVQVVSFKKNTTYIQGPTSEIPFSFYTTADIAQINNQLSVLLENFAQHAEKDPPSKREIAQIATAKVHMVEKDPFKGVLF